ncbi:GON-4-like protein GON-4 -like protein [Collichthys lucidus]|uniref:GON-4-like protein GON-4-like protein n=1 Tax=Collichthys lucidus TaxID=240159 RepID=A0A4U5VLD0_COLLU|nr:GON-4-like protein GON-4 -like protein [Collichthys lucidus]
MNQARKRLKLSRPAVATRTTRPPRADPQILTHDALLPTPPAAGGVEEEEEGYLLVEEDTTDSSLIITMEDSQVEVKSARRRAVRKKRKKLTEEQEEGEGASESEEEEEEEVEIDRHLDQSLETKSKQHNLTTVNVRNIIHEVITNEHVVAMMKAAINETEAVPPFEPKMTRSKFKEVVEKGVVIPAWNISPIKKSSDVIKAPQFVDIPLADEDSSDEEYHPDEEDEDETAEDTFQESDIESTTSSPRGSRITRGEDDSCSPWQTSRSRSRHQRVGPVSMGPPPPPKAPPPKAVTDSTFLEKLHAVEEELAVCMEPYQECDDEDDPEYNFLADIDEPDQEDYRDDKAVRITSQYTHTQNIKLISALDPHHVTKKEVNELMEELFETGALQLLEELRHSPVSYQPQHRPPDARGHTKLVSQFLLRKTLVQVRRRILQCCRPGFPDNVVKRSLPVICPIIKHYNSPSGSSTEAPPPCRSGGARQSYLSSDTCSFPHGTRYPPRLPKHLDFRRIGFLQQPLPPPHPLHDGQVDSSPLPEGQVDSSPLCRLLMSRTNSPADIITTSSLSMTTREQITQHYQTLTSLRRREELPLPGGPALSQVELQERDDVIRMSDEEKRAEQEEEEESEVLLALSESSASSTGSVALDDNLADPEEAESETEQEVTSREEDEELFAQDYLLRVCDVVQVRPGLLDQLLQVLDGFCGSVELMEQQLFERSRQFLRRLGRSLGEGTTLYQQVVSALQRSSTPPPEDMDKISSALTNHPDLQEEFWDFFQQRHAPPLPIATSSTETDHMSQNPPENKGVDRETGSDREEEEESVRAVRARNISMTSRGGKVVVWTREADRTILTACQQRGANQNTFRRVSAQLGDKTAQQVSRRFHDLMNLFHAACQDSTSCSSEPISTQEAAVD